MKTSTRVLLVVLRLAIGWHLLFSAIEKFNKDYWSSEGYLRTASGPLGSTFRDVAGDAVLDQLTLKPIPDGTDLTREPLHKFFPPALEGDWKAYYEQFVAFYHLNERKDDNEGKDDEEAAYRKKILDQVERKFEQQQEATARWLLTGTEVVKITGPNGTSKDVSLTVPERLKLYQDKLAEVRTIQEKEISPASGSIYKDVAQKRLALAQTEANQFRQALSAGITKQTGEMHKALKEALPEPLLLEYGDLKVKPQTSRWKQFERWREWTLLDWSNALVVAGLAVSGVSLLLGLFTRLGCVLGALLLLMFYLPAMPLPGIPESLRNEGYPFINKNIVEMLALLMLATTPSGKWLGLDGLVQFLNPFTYRRRRPPVERRGPLVAEMAAAGAPRLTPIRRDI